MAGMIADGQSAGAGASFIIIKINGWSAAMLNRQGGEDEMIR
jgi:hypothetical protein